MKYPVANFENVLTYLRHQGWTLQEKTSDFYVMKPPAGFPVADFKLKVPYFEEEEDAYVITLRGVILSIASIYKWDFVDLNAFFAMPPAEFNELLQQGDGAVKLPDIRKSLTIQRVGAIA